MTQSRSNHEKAPKCAAFVKAMREAFGEVKVTYVSENGFTLGAKDDSPWVVPTPLPRPAEELREPGLRKEKRADEEGHAATLLEAS